jgi:hypothetical protein
VVFAFNNATSTPATLDSYALWAWTSTGGGGGVTAGAQVAVGCSFANEFNNTALTKVRAMVKINNTSRFKEIWLELRDENNNNYSENFTPGGGSWIELVWAMGQNISTWGSRVHATVTAVGTDSGLAVGSTEFYLEWIALTQ